MKKRLLQLVLLVAVLLCVTVFASAAEVIDSGTCGDNLTWTLTNDGLLTIEGTGDMYCYYSNTKPWYDNQHKIKNVIIDDGVTSIGECAFSNCQNLSSVKIPDNVTVIGDYAFGRCNSLSTVTIPDSVTMIGKSAFILNIGLTEVIIGKGVAYIGEAAFTGCTSLTSIEVNTQNKVFSSLDGVLFNKEKTELIAYPIDKIQNSYRIPDSVTHIGNRAFYNSLLTSVTFPEGLTTIGDYAFSNCSSLIGVTLPNKVTTIGTHAFSECTDLTSIDIPGRVATISKNAFYGCTGLTSVKMSYGVTAIEQHAFACCDSLTSIDIPRSVTTIGTAAFYACTKLTDVLIPSSVVSIGSYPFGFCHSLTSISVEKGNKKFCSSDGVLFNKAKTTLIEYPAGKPQKNYQIPSTVTSIGDAAISSCPNLTGVTIPNSVKTIGPNAFSYNSGLTSITIPASVTAISSCAFYSCDNLTRVYFKGNAPTLTKGSLLDDFFHFPETATLYYKKGTTGWTSSSAYDASAGTWNGYKLKVWTVDPKPSDQTPTDRYGIYVVDEDGTPVSGAEVRWNDHTETTGSNGFAYFPNVTVGTPVIIVSKAGYLTWSNRGTNWTKSKAFDTVILYTETYGALKLSSARYSNSEDMSSSTDVLTKTKKLNLGAKGDYVWDPDDGVFYLSCSVGLPELADHYEVWQGQKRIASSDDGFFELSSASFSKGGNCFVRVIGTNQKQVDTKINLQFAIVKVVEETEFSLSGNKMELEIGSDVPYLGGSTISFDIPLKLPIHTVYNEDTGIYTVGINLQLNSGSYSKEQQIKETREIIDGIIRSNKLNLGTKLNGGQQKRLKSLVKDTNKVKFLSDCNVYFLGYADLNPGEVTADGKLALVIDAKLAEFGYSTWLLYIPVTVQISADLKVVTTADIIYDWENMSVVADVDINPSIKLTAFGGVGVGKHIGVGAYGSAMLEFNARIIGSNRGVKSVELTGALGLKAYIGPFVRERPFAHHTWTLYSPNDSQAIQTPVGYGPANTYGLYDAEGYVLDDLSYLSEESPWLGASESTMATGTASQEKVTLTPLLKDTYRNSKPVMVSGNNTLYAAFLRGNVNTGEIFTVMSKRSSSNTWVEPVRASSNASENSTPALYITNDGTIWLAFTETKDGASSDNLLNYGLNQQLVIGTVDPQTLAFTRVSTFDGSGYLARHQLAVLNGVLTLAWTDTPAASNTDILFPKSGSIYYVQLKNGAWTKPTLLAKVNNTILSMTIGAPNGVLSAACVLDTDQSATTAVDQNLYAVTSNGKTLLAAGFSGRVAFDTLPSMSSPTFIWNANGALHNSSGVLVNTPGITAEFAITDDCVYYSASTGDSANLVAMKYVNGKWSAAMQLTTDDRYLENLSAAVLNGKDYVMGMNTSATIEAEKVEDAKDLVWSAVVPVSDLRIEYAYCSTGGLVAGQDVPVTLVVTNAGDHTVTSIDVSVDGGALEIVSCKPSLDGAAELMSETSIELAPGDSIELVTTIICPEAQTTYQFSVAETGWDDYHVDNNSYETTLGTGDAAVTAVLEQVGNQKTVVASVTNEGVEAISGSVMFYDEDGALLAESTFDALDANGTAISRMDLNDDLWYGGHSIRVVVQCQEEELYTYNNEASLFIIEEVDIPELFDLYGANMKLSSHLTMNFFVAQADITSEGWYAEIVRGENITKINLADCETTGSYYKIIYTGFAAKEMTDEVVVTIYDADGNAVSNPWTDSIRAYAMRVFEKENKTLLVDMLNYGAAAQTHFGYNTDDLANALLTDEQKAYGSQSVTLENKQVAGENFYGASLSLKNVLTLNLYFVNVTEDMTAVITYTNHNGEAREFEKAITMNDSYGVVTLTELALADCREPVTCTILDADGNEIASVTDSIESYCARTLDDQPLNEPLMKFCQSAWNTFH